MLTPSDRATLRYRLAGQSLVTATVLDANGLIIQTLFFRKLQHAGPQKFSWSGISGVPDGQYRIQVVAQDARGRQAQASRDVIADATLAGFDPSAAVFSRPVALRVELDAPATVSLRIVSGSATVATLLDGDFGAGVQEPSWDGAGVRDGRYRAVLTVTDSVATVVRTRALRLDRAAARPKTCLAALPAVPAQRACAVHARAERPRSAAERQAPPASSGSAIAEPCARCARGP